MYNYITYWFNKGQIVNLILVYYVKALDRVHHDVLFDKFGEIGITGNHYDWIKSVLLNHYMSVSISNRKSPLTPSLSGVPQRPVLSPLLFLIFINHIASHLTCKIMMIAGDLKLYFHHNSTSAPRLASLDLQHNTDILLRTSQSWGLRFSTEKCVHLWSSRFHLGDQNLYFLGDVPIKCTSSHKDLGMTVM